MEFRTAVLCPLKKLLRKRADVWRLNGIPDGDSLSIGEIVEKTGGRLFGILM